MALHFRNGSGKIVSSKHNAGKGKPDMSAAQEKVLELIEYLRREAQISDGQNRLSSRQEQNDEIQVVNHVQVIFDDIGVPVLQIETEGGRYQFQVTKGQVVEILDKVFFRSENSSLSQIQDQQRS